MKNKPGFKVNIGGETLLYLIIGIIICIFVLFMPRIYKFFSDLRTGNAFNNSTIIDNNKNNTKEPEENNPIEEPTGDKNLVCTMSTSTSDSNTEETYVFYFNADQLVSVKNEKKYDAITDDYLNYVYSEQAKFNNINNLYKNVPGFSYVSSFEGRTLISTFVYDLTKLNLDSLKNSDESLTISLNVHKDNTLEEVNIIYTDLGYICK